MSLLWFDNFQYYGTDEANMLLDSVWTNIAVSGANGGLQTDPDGVSGTKVLQLSGQGGGSGSSRFTIPTAGDVHNLGFRLWLPSMPANDGQSFGVALKDVSNNNKYLLRTNPSGYLILERTDGCGTDISQTDETNGDVVQVGITASPVLGSGQWLHIEWLMNRTSGDYEIRVEGVNVLSGTDGSVATGNSAIVEWLAGYNASAGQGTYPYIKDVFIADDAGSVNNAFIGPVTIVALQMTSDVSSGWDRSSGATWYTLIDELTPNDSDYIEADDSPPAASIFGFENLDVDVVSVRGLRMISRAWKTDGGDATLQNSLISGVSEDNGASHAVGVSAQLKWDVSEIDPDTAGVWSPAAVNAATLKIDRTA